jgi:hypothetical protein
MRCTLEDAGPDRRSLAALTAWVVVVVAAAVVGWVLLEAGVRLVLPSPPLHAARVSRLGPLLLVPVVVGVVLVRWAPTLAMRLRWNHILVVAGLATVCWGAALAMADGPGGITRGLSWHYEYPADVAKVGDDLGALLRNFTERIGEFEIHVRAHPPGFLVALWGLSRLGWTGPTPATVLALAGAGLATVGVLVAARSLAGEDFARRAGPFVVVAPAAIWLVSSADAVYAALAAWSVAFAAVAAARRSSRVGALAGGLFGLGLLGSYGLVLVAIPVAVILVGRGAARVLLPLAAGAALVLAAAALAGFWWLDGLWATVHEYQILDLERPYAYFLSANVAAFALQVGTATAVALARLRDRAAWLLVGGGLAAAMVANLSGLSKGEVERIWLPFGLLVLVAGGALGHGTSARRWLALQAVTALAIEASVRTTW